MTNDLIQPQLISGLSQISDRYDEYLIDLWGVTHDGQTPYPGVIEALTFLKKSGKSVIFLSNAPRRICVSRKKLEDMGILPDLYESIHTSGEQTHHFLRSFVKENGFKEFYHIGTEKDVSLYEGIGAIKTPDLKAAQFLLCSDTLTWDQQVYDLDEIFEQALFHKLPLVCANSDRVVRYQGGLALCAGSLAERYNQMGGHVIYFGKPHGSVYDHVFKNLCKHPKSKCVAIGDSLYTDIQGAYNQGIDTIFITGGIHLEELASPWGVLPELASLKDLLASHSYGPTYVMASLKM
ncbi:MAG: TIGR01459 family HAD-type hydrolase [Alphaproteobacteria bacterium]|nr:TIGR01459 family HAD-type hydrolase [Alphaproteobacteria bacterium]OJV45667.1 MAG: hypothetical protein BGO28_02270 [Alphaproteobacteria bacterium 43-37]